MVESATTIPAFSVSADIDLSLVAALRRGAHDEGGDVPSINDFVVMAAARALGEFPRFNASFVDGKVECYSRINVGIAVATDDALLVPVVIDADRRTLGEIAAETRRLAEAARRRTLALNDLRDATFTVSNLGMFGVRSFTAIIDPPQVAILAVGGLRGDLVTVTLTCDHRVVYGAERRAILTHSPELHQSQARGFDATTLAPTFRLVYDRPGQSWALAIAARLGLSPALILRADGHRTADARRLGELLDPLADRLYILATLIGLTLPS